MKSKQKFKTLHVKLDAVITESSICGVDGQVLLGNVKIVAYDEIDNPYCHPKAFQERSFAE